MTIFRTRHDCRLCRSTALELVVPLQPLPCATPNFRIDAPEDSPLYRLPVPLDLYLCRACGLLQVTQVCEPHTVFGNYVYRTQMSVGLAEHFSRACDAVLARVEPPAGALIVEAGSNDGTLLRCYRDRGYRVQGVDPAPASPWDIPTLREFFGPAVALAIGRGSAALVLANNVLANIDHIDDFIYGVRDVLADDGVFVFETQYGRDVIDRHLLDVIYHEHLSYFTVTPLMLYLRRMGTELYDVERLPTKGGSIRVYAQKAGGKRPVAPVVYQLMSLEAVGPGMARNSYAEFAGRVWQTRAHIHAEVNKVREAGKKVAGYGVCVGATTLIAQYKLGTKLDVMADDDADKETMRGPGYDLPIGALTDEHGLCVVFAWRYADAIMARHKDWKGRWLVPLPEVRVYD